MKCTYCGFDNLDSALVCGTCARDVAIPATLISERDELLRKRDLLRSELQQARDEIEAIRTGRKRR